MIDVSDIITDPDFVQDFSIVRVTGAFDGQGNWVPTESAPLPQQGIVLPAKLDELQLLPEGERHDETQAIYSLVELTIGDMRTKQSDLIIYMGKYYRVHYTRYYAQCNLWYALVSRIHRDA